MPEEEMSGDRMFGWSVVGSRREVRIPPDAYEEYGFREGERVLVVPGNRRSGGFSILREERLSNLVVSLGRRSLGGSQVRPDGCIVLPAGISVQPGDRLLVSRGSDSALGFAQKGPMFEEASHRGELDVFEADDVPTQEYPALTV